LTYFSFFLPCQLFSVPSILIFLFVCPPGLGLCEEAEFEAQMFGLAQMFIRIPNVQFSTEPPIRLIVCFAIQIMPLFVVVLILG